MEEKVERTDNSTVLKKRGRNGFWYNNSRENGERETVFDITVKKSRENRDGKIVSNITV